MRRTGMAVLAVMAGVVLSGCVSGKTSTFPPKQSTVYVSREGRMYTALVEHYDPSDTGYNADELRAMAVEEAEGYNKEFGAQAAEGPVTVAECTVEGGTATVVYQYTGAEDLCRFTEMSQDMVNHPEELQVTTNSVYLSGEEGKEDWVDARKDAKTTLETVQKKHDLPLIVVTGSVTVQTEGRILYYSGAVSLRDEFTAQVDGDGYIVFR